MNDDRASRTALLIARSLVFTGGDPALAGLIPDESVALARAALRVDSRTTARIHEWLCSRGLRWTIRTAEAAVLPGIQLHYALRKRFISDAADEAIAAGARQVVVVGAGFDALAVRLSLRTEGITCIEVDHPATQAAKQQALSRAGIPTGDLRLEPADLSREPLGEVLDRTGFDPAAKALFVAEGLTMYLREADVQGLLRTCFDRATSDSRFVWTFMEPDGEGRIGFRYSRRPLVDAWLRARGEPFTWGVRPDEVAAFAGALGLDVMEIAGAAELRARYLGALEDDRPLAAGEYLCIVRKP